MHNGDLPVGVSGEMPIWWAPGKPGASSSTDVGAQDLQICVGDAEAVGEFEPPVHVTAEDAEGVVEETVSKKKKTTVHLDHEVKVWFLDYADAQQKRFGWSMRRSLVQAKTLAPELFSHLDPSVPTPKSKKSSSGRPAKIKGAHLTVLAELVHAVTPVLPIGLELKRLGAEQAVSVSWVRRFLQDWGLNYGKFIRQSAVGFTEGKIQAHTHNFTLKIVYQQWKHDIPDERVWNLDDKACRMLPLGDHGWREANHAAVQTSDPRMLRTATPVLPLVAGVAWFSQI
eukprot:851772-Amphidinium_carterae.1